MSAAAPARLLATQGVGLYQGEFQGDNYYRPDTFSAPSLGNPRPRRSLWPVGLGVSSQTTGACFHSGALKGLLSLWRSRPANVGLE